MIYFGKVFFKILRLVPRTFLTTLKVLLVIFVNLLVKILLFLKFTLKIGEFIVPFSKNTTYLSPRGNSYLVPRTVLTTFKALFLVFVNLVVNILLFFEIHTKNWGIFCFFSKNTYFIYHLWNSYLVPRTVLTTFKALLVIFVNLVVNILLFLEFTLKIREFIIQISKNTCKLYHLGNSYLVPYLPTPLNVPIYY